MDTNALLIAAAVTVIAAGVRMLFMSWRIEALERLVERQASDIRFLFRDIPRH